MDPITIDSELAKKLEGGMRSGEAIELPFPVVYVWALNGQAGYKSQGGALYYGGWAAKAEDANALAQTTGVNIPACWNPVVIASRDGSEFEAYTTRYLFVAPIGKRESWLLDGKRYPAYIEGGRRHLQALCYLAEQLGEKGSFTYEPWGPVVLTAKGYQARNMLDAFARWNKATASIRYKIAPGVPAWCFYLLVGTYGRERLAINVGKPGAQSPITPISVYVADKLKEDDISGLFVGSKVAVEMSNYQDQAAEWLGAWKQPIVDGAQEAEQFAPENAAPAEDDIPF